MFHAAAGTALNWSDLGVGPVALDGYIFGILLGWWYLTRLLRRPGAPMTRAHADDFVFYATLGIILGGRIGYVLFYAPRMLLSPLAVLRLWDGGMSLHGGFLGVIVALILFCRRFGLSFLRVCDYVACATPFGLFLVRLANFANGELWGRPSTLPWAMIFPDARDGVPRHPSQLYEAGLEGIVLFTALAFLFWRTDARYQPGRLFGAGLTLYGLFRFLLERVRQPDYGMEHLGWGLTMGQTLSLPMILVGLWLFVTAPGRRIRVEGIAGSTSVA